MRVFRTTYRDASGNKRKAAKWYVEFRDHAETIHRLPAFASKPASEELGRNLEAKGNSAIHVEVVTARVRRIIAGCGASRPFPSVQEGFTGHENR